ncbi:MAG: MYXO-CTERM sorting domain-containing protein [Myxococcales bacterium]
MTLRRVSSLANKGVGNWRSRASVSALCLPLLIGCSSPAGQVEADGSIRGELHVYRIDFADGHSEREFFLAAEGKRPEDIHLKFATDPGLQPWTNLKVWGTPTKDGITVERFQEITEATSDVAVASEPLLKVTKKTRTVGFVMMDVGNGVNITADAANAAIFGTRTPTQAGLNQFYTENSYGAFGFTGDILGPKTVNNLGTCQQSAIDVIEGGWPDIFGKDYDHWMQYIGSSYDSCGWGGIGGEGTAARPAYGSWYNGYNDCTVLNQEVGHNLGLMHSNSITCNGAPFADDPQTCQGAEYGNRHTVMGSGCAHLGAYEKWYEGFFGGCNAVRATATGTYTLLPTEIPCDGVQALQLPMPKTRSFHNTQGTAIVVKLSKYYLELRTKTSIDGKEAGPFVLVTVGGEVPASNKTSEFTWVLDMDPTTTKTAEGMTAGKTFTDPAGGVSFTVQSIDATHATVDVTVAASTGPATCLDGSAFVGPGPSSCGTAGAGGAGGGAGSGAGGASSGGGASNGGASHGGTGGSSTSSGGAGGTAAGAGGGAGMISSGTAGVAGLSGSAGRGGSAGASTSAAGAASAGASSGSAGAPAQGSPNSGSDSSGCSCRAAPVTPSRSGLASVALLVLGYAVRRRRQGAR